MKSTTDIYNEEANIKFFYDPNQKDNLITKIINKEMDCVFKFIDRQKLNKNNGVVLDIGCSGGRYTFKLAESKVRTIGMDIAFKALKFAEDHKNNKDNPSFMCATVTHLPFKDNSFDAIVCMELLHHLDDNQLQLALGELRRIMKPSATVVLELKNSLNPIMLMTYKRFMKGKFKGTEHLMLTRTPFKYAKFIKKAGLKVVKKKPLYSPVSLFAPIIMYKIRKC